jgi:outer membrane protein OmpA-like peptidoglycan-associated protein
VPVHLYRKIELHFKIKPMKILIVGFLVFFSWSILSTYIYVCKIKGLCYELEPIPVAVIDAIHVDASLVDTISKTLVQKQEVKPEPLLIYFAFDKSEISSNSEAVRYFEESMAYMFNNINASLNIIGYTDAIGSDEYNLALGYRRAKSVQNFFESKGMPSEKIRIESKGEKNPAEDNNSIAGRTKNRRAVITIKP